MKKNISLLFLIFVFLLFHLQTVSSMQLTEEEMMRMTAKTVNAKAQYSLRASPPSAMNDENVHLTDSYYSKFSPALAMDDEETPLTKKTQRTDPSVKKKSGSPKDKSKEDKTESTTLKQSIKHIEPGFCQRVQYIRCNRRWDTWRLDEPYYDISDYTSGCGTCCAIFCCFCCCSTEDYGGCYFKNDDDLTCFDTWKLNEKDTDGEGKVMTRRDALRVMEVVNREKREYYSNNPKERVKCFETWESATLKTRGWNFDGSVHYSVEPKGNVSYHAFRSKEVRKYERKLRAKGMKFVANDLDLSSDDKDSDDED